MAGRPGLYEELERFGILEKGRVIVLGDGSDALKADHIAVLLLEAGSDFDVTPKRVFNFRHKLNSRPIPESAKDTKNGNGAVTASASKSIAESPRSKAATRPKSKPPPGPNKGSFKKGDPRAGAPFGNDNGTKTGEHRNPLIHPLPAILRRAVQGLDELSSIERLRHSVDNYDARLVDMNLRLARLMHKRQKYMVIETKFVRQEGDGEAAGTFRQAQRQRIRVDDQIMKMHEAITRTQKQRDSAVEKLHKMEQAEKGQRKKGLADVLAGMRQGGDDDE